MKKYFLLSLVVTSIMACQSCGGDTPSTPSTPSPETEEPTVTIISVDKSFDLEPPSADMQQDQLSPFIGLWAYTKAFTSDPERMEDYKGRWVDFKADGTFTYGKYQEQTNKGNWWLLEKPKRLAMDFDDDKENIDLDWKINTGVDVFILLGNTNRNKTGDQIQVKRTEAKPQPQ